MKLLKLCVLSFFRLAVPIPDQRSGWSANHSRQRTIELGLLDHEILPIFQLHSLLVTLIPLVGRQNELEQIYQMSADSTCQLVPLTTTGRRIATTQLF